MKKILLISLFLIALITLPSVSANENLAEISGQASQVIVKEAENTIKKDWNMEIYINEEVNKNIDNDLNNFISVKNIPYDIGPASFQTYVDNVHVPDYDIDYSGYKIFDPSALSLGNHTFTVVFSGNEKYNPINSSANINVVDAVINIPDTLVKDYDDYVKVNLAEDATGSVSVYVDNKEYATSNLTLDSELRYKYAIIHLNLDFKTYLIDVRYSGDEKYNSRSKNKTVTFDYYISNSKPNISNSKDTFMIIEMPKDIKGNVNVEIEGVNYTAQYDSKKEAFILNVENLNPGEHEVKITYLGDDKYPQKTITSSITIFPEISVPSLIEYTSIGEFTLKLNKNSTGNLTLYIGDESTPFRSAEMIGGYANITISNLNVGSYSFKINYTDGEHNLTKSGHIQVYPKVSVPREIYAGDDEYAIFTADTGATGKISITNGYGNSVSAKLVNGSAKLSLSSFKEGEIIYMTYFDGRTIEMPNSFLVKENLAKITGAKNIEMYYCDGTVYQLKIYGCDGNLTRAGEIVNYRVGNTISSAKTNENGIVTIPLTENPGKWILDVSYKNVEITKSLTVKKILSLDKVTVKKSAKKLVLTAKLAKKLKGKTVTFKFNGKTYKAKTNSKGIAKVTVEKSILKKLKTGKKVTYQATYVKSTVKKTVKVQK